MHMLHRDSLTRFICEILVCFFEVDNYELEDESCEVTAKD